MAEEKRDKLTRMRELMLEFDSPEQAFLIAKDLHMEKLRVAHIAKTKPMGSVKVADWEALAVYMNTPGDNVVQILPELQAQLKVAVCQQNDADMFALLVAIARAVKPHNLYEQPEERS